MDITTLRIIITANDKLSLENYQFIFDLFLPLQFPYARVMKLVK